ncbi:MAG: serine dehydratase, partial [Ligilactobacillus ruminis]
MSGNYKSVFDIIGPVMVGPSSSHTAGAVAIGQVAHKLFSQKITQVTIDYYESFAKT